MHTEAVVQTMGLGKRYGRTGQFALADLDLSVYRGEVFGYLGPNGAGKTTTIRLLLDFIRPTTGEAYVLGMDAQKDSLAIRRRVGFLPGELSLWENQTGWQIINYMSALRGDVQRAYLNQLIERLAFDPSKLMRNYSTGNKRKLGLILALMHQPELLILDEPTVGLDPLMQQTFHQLVREAQARGATVFLSSHILSEVQAICERVAILREGRLRAVERVADLMRVNFTWVTLTLRQPAAPSLLAGVAGVSEVSAEGDRLKFRLSGDFDPILRAISSHYVVDVRVQEPSLEEVFLTFYGNGSAEAAQKQPMEVAR
ncbi:MAG: ATP-binding cassette domain-containing protein [Aggregatilineales bacterium]